jgi:hypothetical protein
VTVALSATWVPAISSVFALAAKATASALVE